MRRRETTLELLIWKPVPGDSGVYSCVCADQKTSATIKITGEDEMMSLAPGLSDLSKHLYIYKTTALVFKVLKYLLKYLIFF